MDGGVGVAGIAGVVTTASELPGVVGAGVVSVAQPRTTSKIERRIASFVFGLSNIPTSCPVWVPAQFFELAPGNYIAVRVGWLPFTAHIGSCRQPPASLGAQSVGTLSAGRTERRQCSLGLADPTSPVDPDVAEGRWLITPPDRRQLVLPVATTILAGRDGQSSTPPASSCAGHRLCRYTVRVNSIDTPSDSRNCHYVNRSVRGFRPWARWRFSPTRFDPP